MERALDSYGPPTILQDSYSTLKANEERERCSCQGGIEHNLSSYTHTFMPPTPPLPTYNQSGFRTTIPGPLSEDQEQNGKTRSLCCFQLSPESSMPADCKCVCFYFCSSFRRPLRAWLLCSKSTQPRARFFGTSQYRRNKASESGENGSWVESDQTGRSAVLLPHASFT